MNIKWRISSPEYYFEEGKILTPSISGQKIGGNLDFNIWSKALRHMIDFGNTQIDDLDKYLSIRDTLIDIYNTNDINASSFLNKLKVNLRNKRNRGKESKYLIASISVDFPSDFQDVKIFDSTINLIESFSDNSPIKQKYNEQNHIYTGIVAHSKSTSNDIKHHIRNLNLFRAFLCRYTNPGMVISFNKEDAFTPINTIRLSKTMILLNQEGEEVDSDTNMYNNFTLRENFKLKDKKNIIDDCTIFFNKIEKCAYNKKIKESLLIFVNSLDELDQDVAFVLFWNCLDKLSNSSKGNYDAVLERVASLYSNPRYHKIVLENLKNIRNDFTHHGTRCKDAQYYCFILQSYFFHLLDFHLENTSFFNSIGDAYSVLSYLSKQDYIEEMSSIVSKLKLRKPRAII